MPVATLKSTIRRGVEERLDRAAKAYLGDPNLVQVDFSTPTGEPALVDPESVSWRIFKNPVTLFIGGVTAVIMELAEPRVRTGVWENTSFREDPVRRLKRTGQAAMVTVYGARSVAERMIETVNRMHARVEGMTPDGVAYAATDPELLRWVQATAAFGFIESYSAYATPLTDNNRNQYYKEGSRAAALYGATGAPQSLTEARALMDDMMPQLEASEIIFEFLSIMKRAGAFPQPAQLAQHSLVRAAVEIVPDRVREITGLGSRFGLRPLEGALVRRMTRRAERLILRSSPAVQACRRLGLPDDYLYER